MSTMTIARSARGFWFGRQGEASGASHDAAPLRRDHAPHGWLDTRYPTAGPEVRAVCGAVLGWDAAVGLVLKSAGRSAGSEVGCQPCPYAVGCDFLRSQRVHRTGGSLRLVLGGPFASDRPWGKAPDGVSDRAFEQGYVYMPAADAPEVCDGAIMVSTVYPVGTDAGFLSEDYPVILRCFLGTPDDSFRFAKR